MYPYSYMGVKSVSVGMSTWKRKTPPLIKATASIETS